MIDLVFLIPVVAAVLCVVLRKHTRTVEVLASVSVLLSLLFLLLAASSSDMFTKPVSGFYGLLYLDPLGFLFTLMVVAVTFFIMVYSVGYLREEIKEHEFTEDRLWRYYSLLLIFMACMVLVTMASNLLTIWVALEATTLTSVFLISFYDTKESLEAAWKYFIICSLGITLALVGIIILAYGQQQAGLPVDLNIFSMLQNSNSILPLYLKLAFAFIFVGYGTKMGLVPLHEWLPDAHSQAPTPVSAILSGVLLSTAFYAILRVYMLLMQNSAVSSFASTLFIAFGLVSLAFAALRLFSQSNYKRLLAYSSIENMGIIALAVGIGGPLGLFAALFLVIAHSLSKPLAFLVGGIASLKFGTKEISKIGGIARNVPLLGSLFILANIGVAGSVPFGTFVAEIALLAAALYAGHFIIAILIVIFTTIAFGNMLFKSSGMAFGETITKPGKYSPDLATMACVGCLLLLAIFSGFLTPGPLIGLVNSAVAVIMG